MYQRKKSVSVWQRCIAFLLCTVLLLTGLQFPPSEVKTSAESGNEIGNEIGNIHFEALWQNDSLDYEWHSYTAEKKAVKITLTYTSGENHREFDIYGYDYYETLGEKGSDLTIQIPGIGGALRGNGILPASYDVDKWKVSYDSSSDIYTFYWREDVSSKMSMDGGFMLSWTFNSRECSEFSKEITPIVTLKNETLSLPPLHYEFTNVRDTYDNELASNHNLSSLFIDNADPSYIWNGFTAQIKLYEDGQKGWNSRGLSKSRYFVEIPSLDATLTNGDGAPGWVAESLEPTLSLADRLKVALPDSKSSWGYSYTDIVYDNERKAWGFYLFNNKGGDLKNENISFYIGYQKPEPDYIYDKSGEILKVKPEDEKYQFRGYEYNVGKSTNLTSVQKQQGINYTHVTSGEEIGFTLTGSATRNYSSDSNPDEDEIKEIEGSWDAIYKLDVVGHLERLYLDDDKWTVQSLDDVTTILPDESTVTDVDGTPISENSIRIKKRYYHGKIIKIVEDSDDTSVPDELGENDGYVMVIEDAVAKNITVDRNDGTKSSLAPEEYKIVSVTMPQKFIIDKATNSPKMAYSYTIYSLDADGSVIDEVSGTTAESRTWPMTYPDDTKKIRIEITVPESDGSFSTSLTYSPEISIKFNLDEATIRKDEGYITNYDDFYVKYEKPVVESKYVKSTYVLETDENGVEMYVFKQSDDTEYTLKTNENGETVLDASGYRVYTYTDADGITKEISEVTSDDDGKLFIIETRNTPVRDDNGQIKTNPAKTDVLEADDSVKLRDSQLVLSSSAKFSEFNSPKSDTDYKLFAKITSTATVTSEVSADINSITLYSRVPDGLTLGKLDKETKKAVNGTFLDYSGTKLYKSVEGEDGHTRIEEIDLSQVTIIPAYDETTRLLSVTFNFKGETPQNLMLDDENNVNTLSFSYDVYLESTEVWNDSLNHTPKTYSYAYINGTQETGKLTLVNTGDFANVSGGMTDQFDFNGNGKTDENIMSARGSATSVIKTDIESWDELAPKRVISYFSHGTTTSTFAKLYNSEEDGNERNLDAMIYRYRLSLQLGNSDAENLMFYDYLEEEGNSDKLGTLLGMFGGTNSFSMELYYKTGELTPNLESDGKAVKVPYLEFVPYDKSITIDDGTTQAWSNVWKPFNLNTIVEDVKASTKDTALLAELDNEEPAFSYGGQDYTVGQLAALSQITAIGIKVTKTDGNRIPAKENLYADISMLAPGDKNADSQKVVNRYCAVYDGITKDTTIMERVVISNPVDVTFHVVMQNIELTKKDAVTGEPMQNVEFRLYECDENGEVLREDTPDFSAVTDGLGVAAIEGVSHRIYEVKEVKIPVNQDDKSTYLEKTQNPDEEILLPLVGYSKLCSFKLDLTIFDADLKQDTETKQITVKDEDGNEQTVDIEHSVKYLYYSNNELQTVTYENLPLNDAGDAMIEKTDIVHHYAFTLKNERKTGTVRLVKKDSTRNNRPVAKAVYRLYNATGQPILVKPKKEEDGVYQYLNTPEQNAVYDLQTNADSVILVEEVPWGDYYFQEYTAPTGYEIDPYHHHVSVKRLSTEENEALNASESHESEIMQGLTLKKIDYDTNQPISGAIFNLMCVSKDYYEDEEGKYHLYDDDTHTPDYKEFEPIPEYSNMTTDLNGEIVIPAELAFGYYRFKEQNAANGYEYPEEDKTYSQIVHLCPDTVGTVQTIVMTNKALPPSLRVYKTDENGNPQKNVKFGLYRIMNPEAFRSSLNKSKKEPLTGEDLHYISLNKQEILDYTALCKKPDPSYYTPACVEIICLTENPSETIEIADYNNLSAEDKGKYTIKELEYVYYCLKSEPNENGVGLSPEEYAKLDNDEKDKYQRVSVPMIKQLHEGAITDEFGYTDVITESDSFDPLNWNNTYFFYEISSAQGYKDKNPVQIFELTNEIAESDPENPGNLLYTYHAVNKQELGKIKLTKCLYQKKFDGSKDDVEWTDGLSAEFELHMDDSGAELLAVREKALGVYEYLTAEEQPNGEILYYDPEDENGLKALYAVGIPQTDNTYKYYAATLNQDGSYTKHEETEIGDIVTKLTTNTEDGTIQIRKLPWNAYYLQEVTAPENYKLNPNYVRFSVTEYTAVREQELKCEDEYGKEGKITIQKHVNTLYDSFGEASFLYTIRQTHTYNSNPKEGEKIWPEIPEDEQPVWTRMLTVTDKHTLANSVAVAGLEAGIFEVTEVDAYRYDFKSASVVSADALCQLVRREQISEVTPEDIDKLTNLTGEERQNYKNLLPLYQKDTISGRTVTVALDLSTRDTETIHYENELTDYTRYSHTDNRINHITSRQLTEVSIHYQGIRRLDTSTVGTNPDGTPKSSFYRYDGDAYYYYLVSEAYLNSDDNKNKSAADKWTENNLFITLTYDDGTTKPVSLSDEHVTFWLSADGQEPQKITKDGENPYFSQIPYRFEASGTHIYTFRIDYQEGEGTEPYTGDFTISMNLPEDSASYYEVIYCANNSQNTGYFGTNHNKVRNIVRYIYDKEKKDYVECDKYRNPIENENSNYIEPTCGLTDLQFVAWDNYSDYFQRTDGEIDYVYTSDNSPVYTCTPEGENESVYCTPDGSTWYLVTEENDVYTTTDIVIEPDSDPKQVPVTVPLIVETFDHEAVESALQEKKTHQTTYVVYAKYSGERAMFVDGKTFNTIVKGLNSNYGSVITAIRYASKKADNAVRADVNRNLTADQPGYNNDFKQEIWIWLEGTTLYWYSPDPMPYMNDNHITLQNNNLGQNYFTNWTKLKDIGGLSNWDVSLAQNMQSMFYKTSIADTSALKKWRTPEATNMKWMFAECSSLQFVQELNFEITNVTSMESMFEKCSNLVEINKIKFYDDTSAENIVSKSAQGIFKECSIYAKEANYSNITIASKYVTSYQDAFNGCKMLDTLENLTLDVTGHDTSNALYQTFSGCEKLTEFKNNTITDSSTDSETKISAKNMFYNNTQLQTISDFTFESQNVDDMSNMFQKCGFGRQDDTGSYDLSSLNTSNVTTMASMFEECKHLKTLKLDYKKFTAGDKLTTVESMFNECVNLSGLDLRGFGKCSKLTTIKQWFRNCKKLTYIDLSHFETSNNLSDIYAVFFHTSEDTGGTVGKNTGCAVWATGKWDNSYTTNNNDNFDYFRINMYGRMYKNTNSNKGSSLHLDIQNYTEKADGTPDYSRLVTDDNNNRLTTGYFNDANSAYYKNTFYPATYGEPYPES